MTTKKFKYRVDSNNKIAVKEVVSKAVKGTTTRLSVLLGVDEALKLSNVSVFKDNTCISAEDLAENRSLLDYLIELKTTGTPIYYALDDLTYLCVVTMTMIDKTVTKKNINLYCPIGYTPENEIVCQPVSQMFPHEVRRLLIASLHDYVLFRSL